MSNAGHHKEMLAMVAKALGPELCPQVAFVGGCTTSLYLTDEFTREQVRHTDDVDVIVSLVGVASFSRLQAKLRELGFQDSMDEDDPICAMKLGAMRVDFMPDDESILGFSNRWYQEAWSTAEDYELQDKLTIKLIKPVYFVATKLEAFHGRGGNDPLGSRDIEDLLNLFDGRSSILAEIEEAKPNLRHFIRVEIKKLLENSDFEYAVQACAMRDADREALIYRRLEQAASD